MLRIQYLYNAACVYEHEGYQILSDPWFYPAFEGSWTQDPPLKSKPSDYFGVDAIYLSHLHPDHFDEKALQEFPKDKAIIYLDHEPNFLAKKIRSLGFTDLHGLVPEKSFKMGPFDLMIFEPFTKHPFYESEIGNLIDSALIIQAGGIKILNGNDNTLTPTAADMLVKQFGAFDLVQLVDSCAGPYPACFTNLSHEEKLSEKERILTRHIHSMIECAKILKAKKVQPFAGHYKLQGKLAALNQYLAVYEPHEVAEKIKLSGLEPLLLYEGDSFVFL